MPSDTSFERLLSTGDLDEGALGTAKIINFFDKLFNSVIEGHFVHVAENLFLAKFIEILVIRSFFKNQFKI
jgi:hypothetical protein